MFLRLEAKLSIKKRFETKMLFHIYYIYVFMYYIYIYQKGRLPVQSD
jgi:hypothetical protein